MQKNNTFNREMLTRSEKNYFEFMQLLTEYITQYFSSSHHIISSKKEKLQAEKQIIQTLTLIEKIHMNLLYRHSLYSQTISFENKNNPFHPLMTMDMYKILKQLQNTTNHYHFLDEENQTICQKIISQIMVYYPQHSNTIKIFIMAPLSPPWKPLSIQSFEKRK